MTVLANVDKDSLTWKAVEAFIQKESSDAIASLIADDRSEQQRGIIEALNRLKKLAEDEEFQPVVSTDY